MVGVLITALFAVLRFTGLYEKLETILDLKYNSPFVLLSIGTSVCNLDDVISSIQSSTQTQDDKISSFDTLEQNTEDFIETVVSVDSEVADVINQQRAEFYEEYAYLKPECEKNTWDKLCDGCKSVGEWCKEHWKVVATVFIVIAAVGIICAGIFRYCRYNIFGCWLWNLKISIVYSFR